MKRLLLSLLLVVMLLPAVTYGDEPAYIFKLSVNGRESCNALPGDTVTVTVTLHRTAGDEPMYAMQDEVTFDPAFFALQPDSLLLHSGVTSSVIPLRDGRQAVCLHFLSFGDGEDWAAETVVASFQLKVLSRSGTGVLSQRSFLVSSRDGMELFPVTTEDSAVEISDQCHVTFESNGGSAVEPLTVPWGEAIAAPQEPTREGYDFGGWFANYDLTRPWDFTAAVTHDMTLYAAWQPVAVVASPSPAVIVAIAVALLAAAVWGVSRLRKKQ